MYTWCVRAVFTLREDVCAPCVRNYIPCIYNAECMHCVGTCVYTGVCMLCVHAACKHCMRNRVRAVCACALRTGVHIERARGVWERYEN